MKKCLIILIISFLIYLKPVQAQTPFDSIRLEFSNLKGSSDNDSTTLQKIVSFLYYNSLDSVQFKIIEQDIQKYKQTTNNDLAFGLLLLICNKLIDNGNYYQAIDKLKELAYSLDNYSTPYQKYILLEALTTLRVPYRNSDRINESISYFLNLASKYEQKNDSQLVSSCYNVLRSTFGTLGIMDKAIYYQQKSLLFINPNDNPKHDYLINFGASNIGRLGFINRKAVLASMYVDENEPEKALPLLYEAKTLCEKYKDSIDIGDAPFVLLQILKSKILLKADSIPEYFNLTETAMLGNPIYISILNQTKGNYFLLSNQLDSAENYLRITLKIRDSIQTGINTFSGVLIPGYFIAKINLIRKEYVKAITILLSELEKSKKFNLRPTILQELNLLAEIYKEKGDYKNSMLALEEYNKLKEEIIADEANYRSITFEVEQSIAEKEKSMKLLADENEFNRKTKFYLIGIVCLIGLLALGIYNRYQSKKKANIQLEEKNMIITKEKERSDELLLNILPSEVAEELKTKGSAAAKQFDDVTVMFTDFKNFTQISEKLTPSQLVAEIDTCFKAFDNIITKFNIEKIKTIGDSYMCVGGLPKANTTHAENVVNAAIEILNFMEVHNREKKANGELHFEIRIGINTGTVVAGIVGVKKFAYDILGIQ